MLQTDISIHALLAESDLIAVIRFSLPSKFLSTLSLRRATTHGQGAPVGVPYFYPRSPCGERLAVGAAKASATLISSHALLAESDVICNVPQPWVVVISIHALLAESDDGRPIV